MYKIRAGGGSRAQCLGVSTYPNRNTAPTRDGRGGVACEGDSLRLRHLELKKCGKRREKGSVTTRFERARSRGDVAILHASPAAPHVAGTDHLSLGLGLQAGFLSEDNRCNLQGYSPLMPYDIPLGPVISNEHRTQSA